MSKIKRKHAERAADILLEEGGMAKIGRERLRDLAFLALRQEAIGGSPGHITFSYINHGDGCWSIGESFESLDTVKKRIQRK